MTSDSTGKIVRAVLQEADYIDGSNRNWYDVRELPVSSDGRVIISTNQGVIQYPKTDIPQTFQDAFSEGELEL